MKARAYMGGELDCGKRLGKKQRLLSLGECVLGTFFVLGHNVWHVLPNEVYLLVAVGLLSLWLRNGGLGGAGLKRPQSWGRTAAAAALTAVLLQLEDVVTDPIGRLFTHQPQHLSSVMPHTHDLRQAMLAIGIVWTFAAFGEEIGYRAYLMTRFGEAAGGGRTGKAVSLVAVSVLFGFGHFYKGPAGVVESTASGLLLGTVYLVTGNLWAPILAHGLSDTFAVTALYYGWFS
jgi:membrane protease YdiL (CAAX protease family)